MPPIQVKDCPSDLYEELKRCAAREHRNISSQMIAIIEWYLASQPQPPHRSPQSDQPLSNTQTPAFSDGLSRIERRKRAFGRMANAGCKPPEDGMSAADLVREAREEAR